MSDDLSKLYSKKKFHSLFDAGVLSINSGATINKEMSYLFKSGARIHVESADCLAILNKEQRQDFRTKIMEKCEQAEWRLVAKPPYNHHMLFEVDKIEDSTAASTTNLEDDIDDLNLDDL